MASKSMLYIPEVLEVGFKNREDTFTGKLAFLTYKDAAGAIRQENAWRDWCDKSIPKLSIPNVPTAGFIFNKGVERYSYWGNSGRSKIRVHDPRNFEFEISVDNMLSLISHSIVDHADITEKCVFAWMGRSLVLLPTNSVLYLEAVANTKAQNTPVSLAEMRVGNLYKIKSTGESVCYLGRHDWYDFSYVPSKGKILSVKKKDRLVFRDCNGAFSILKTERLCDCHATQDAGTVAQWIEDFIHSIDGQMVVDYAIEPLVEMPGELNKNYYYNTFICKKIDENSLLVKKNFWINGQEFVNLTNAAMTGFDKSFEGEVTCYESTLEFEKLKSGLLATRWGDGGGSTLDISNYKNNGLSPDELVEDGRVNLRFGKKSVENLNSLGWRQLFYVLADGTKIKA